MSTVETPEERKKREDLIRDVIMAKLVESGEKDKLKEFLRERLALVGWQDEMKEFAKDVIRRKGTEKISVEELVTEIIPHGRSTIPKDIKDDLLQRVRNFLQQSS
jgi:enhancer of yellow 2 transcription factor